MQYIYTLLSILNFVSKFCVGNSESTKRESQSNISLTAMSFSLDPEDHATFLTGWNCASYVGLKARERLQMYRLLIIMHVLDPTYTTSF